VKTSPQLAGVAGEYFVAAELSRRGHVASISLRNTRGIDIIATNQTASRSVTIQCKTNQLGRKAWLLNEKSENFVRAGHFYVFVVLGGVLERPSYHIVPSRVVAKHISASHRQWRRKPRRDGLPHGDSTMRKFSDPNDDYLEKWNLLGL
jgi:hypothetical protein